MTEVLCSSIVCHCELPLHYVIFYVFMWFLCFLFFSICVLCSDVMRNARGASTRMLDTTRVSSVFLARRRRFACKKCQRFLRRHDVGMRKMLDATWTTLCLETRDTTARTGPTKTGQRSGRQVLFGPTTFLLNFRTWILIYSRKHPV